MEKTSEDKFDVLARLTELLQMRGMTVYKLAKLSGIPQSTIATWYQKNLYPPIDKLERICGILNISLSDFFQTYDDETVYEKETAELIAKWLQLTSEQRTVVNDLLNLLLQTRK